VQTNDGAVTNRKASGHKKEVTEREEPTVEGSPKVKERVHQMRRFLRNARDNIGVNSQMEDVDLGTDADTEKYPTKSHDRNAPRLKKRRKGSLREENEMLRLEMRALREEFVALREVLTASKLRVR
jgi:hypothetical protein